MDIAREHKREEKPETDCRLRRGERKRRGPKPKPISAGMSRYRRREANARERQRQGEINKGFEHLRERVPHPTLSKGKCEKLRKIDILHVAISYIRALENVLESGEPGINDFANSLYSVVPQDFFSNSHSTNNINNKQRSSSRNSNSSSNSNSSTEDLDESQEPQDCKQHLQDLQEKDHRPPVQQDATRGKQKIGSSLKRKLDASNSQTLR